MCIADPNLGIFPIGTATDVLGAAPKIADKPIPGICQHAVAENRNFRLPSFSRVWLPLKMPILLWIAPRLVVMPPTFTERWEAE
jgi:hypothetical protein